MYPIKRVFYLWASYDGDSIVSEPAVAPLFSNSIYTATHQKISYGKNISSLLKGEDAKALNRKIFTNKVLSQQCFSMTFYCNDVVKRVGKYYSLHSTVPRCASHWIIKLRYLSRNFFRNVTNFMVTLYRMWIRTSQNQKTNWIGGKGFNVEKPVKIQIRQMLQKN